MAQHEVIPLGEELSDEAAERLWPTFSGGAISIDQEKLVIPDGNELFIQERTYPFDQTKVKLHKQVDGLFIAYQVVAKKRVYFYSALGKDGRFYLFKMNQGTGEILGPVLRHGTASERMFLLEDDRFVVTGLYRPELTQYLKLIESISIEEQKRNNKARFDALYAKHKSYTISIYDKELMEVDSGNVIDRTGDNARAFERLFPEHPVDVSKSNDLFLIDNDQGYVVERYSNIKSFSSKFRINNPAFKAIPKVLTHDEGNSLRSQDRAYSIAYCLFYKKGLILTGFFQAPIMYQERKGPFYYDVSTESGELLASGSLGYPFLAEDDNSKIFVYVNKKGGWFESDQHYLVGVTMHDLIAGRVSKQSIDASIEQYSREHR